MGGGDVAAAAAAAATRAAVAPRAGGVRTAARDSALAPAVELRGGCVSSSSRSLSQSVRIAAFGRGGQSKEERLSRPVHPPPASLLGSHMGLLLPRNKRREGSERAKPWCWRWWGGAAAPPSPRLWLASSLSEISCC